jgi:hypothetical protein
MTGVRCPPAIARPRPANGAHSSSHSAPCRSGNSRRSRTAERRPAAASTSGTGSVVSCPALWGASLTAVQQSTTASPPMTSWLILNAHSDGTRPPTDRLHARTDRQAGCPTWLRAQQPLEGMQCDDEVMRQLLTVYSARHASSKREDGRRKPTCPYPVKYVRSNQIIFFHYLRPT